MTSTTSLIPNTLAHSIWAIPFSLFSVSRRSSNEMEHDWGARQWGHLTDTSRVRYLTDTSDRWARYSITLLPNGKKFWNHRQVRVSEQTEAMSFTRIVHASEPTAFKHHQQVIVSPNDVFGGAKADGLADDLNSPTHVVDNHLNPSSVNGVRILLGGAASLTLSSSHLFTSTCEKWDTQRTCAGILESYGAYRLEISQLASCASRS